MRLLGLAAAAAVLAACQNSGNAPTSSLPTPSADRAQPGAVLIDPGAGSDRVPVDTKVRVSAPRGGELTSVHVSSLGPGRVSGTLSQDRERWTATTPLAPGARYTVSVRSTDAAGKTLTKTATFTTEPAERTFVGEYHPDKGTTVGVGMPISIVFNHTVADRAAIERNLSVSSSPAVEGAWSWMKDRDGNDRIDYRPHRYWRPNTQVTLRMHLAGVDAGDGVYGTQERTVHFRVGQSVVTTVDAADKTMTVVKNGTTLRTLRVSAGKEGFETWNGTMLVLSKVPTIRMDSSTVGIFGQEAYDLGEVKWDVQLTPSGTYVHAAPWNAGKFGLVNSSHGCIGLSTEDARWFYEQVNPGDPVTVIHSADTVAVNNGYGDWNVDWSTWTSGSALTEPFPSSA
ncbi:Ig-like domain-containing protein [Streptomyces althioticus]|uniref:L,D-transpeptidase n=1 Tax=Streptomyces TaxID=1883 RepID=UPI0033C62761